MNGYKNKRVVLQANTPVVVDFGRTIGELSIARMTSEPVYYKVGEHPELSVDDLSTNILTDETPATDYINYNKFSKITFVSAALAGVQWDTRE